MCGPIPSHIENFDIQLHAPIGLGPSMSSTACNPRRKRRHGFFNNYHIKIPQLTHPTATGPILPDSVLKY